MKKTSQINLNVSLEIHEVHVINRKSGTHFIKCIGAIKLGSQHSPFEHVLQLSSDLSLHADMFLNAVVNELISQHHKTNDLKPRSSDVEGLSEIT